MECFCFHTHVWISAKHYECAVHMKCSTCTESLRADVCRQLNFPHRRVAETSSFHCCVDRCERTREKNKTAAPGLFATGTQRVSNAELCESWLESQTWFFKNIVSERTEKREVTICIYSSYQENKPGFGYREKKQRRERKRRKMRQRLLWSQQREICEGVNVFVWERDFKKRPMYREA